MFLKDFEALIHGEYPDWKKTYLPLKTRERKPRYYAILPSDSAQSSQPLIIGIYIQGKSEDKYFIRKQNNTYLKGSGTSRVYITEQEFNNHVIRLPIE